MSVLILSILVQVALIIHVVKTGRNQIWIWVLALLSLPGALAYIAVEILPELLGSRAAQRTARGLRQAVDPGRELRRYENEARVGGDVVSRQRYAEERVRHERYEEAIGQYREALTGLYEHDPNLMLGLAQAQLDRKSTRLNSSHVENSYAVFCLKKKNSGKKNSFMTFLALTKRYCSS